MTNFRKELSDPNGRKCLACGVFKPWSEFVKDKRSRTGYGSSCLCCKRICAIEYAHTDAGRISRRKASRKYYGTERGREKKREQGRRYTSKLESKRRKAEYDLLRRQHMSSDEIDERNRRRRESYAADPSKRKESNRKWKSRNPGKVHAQVQRRRAIIRGATGVFSDADWLDVLENYDWRCAYCGCSGKMSVDHVIPLSKGGAHDKENIVPACQSCNSRKHTADWSFRLVECGAQSLNDCST